MATRRRHKRKRTVHHKRKHSVFSMNPKRRRRRSRRTYAANPRRRRHYGRNPPALRGVLNQTLWAGVGYVGTKFAVGAVLPAINIAATPPSLTSIAAKLAVAYGVAWGGEKVLGVGRFEPLFIGGAVSAIQDFVALYIAPSVPALAGYGDMGAYYRPPMISAPRLRTRLPSPGMGAYAGDLGAEDMI